MTVAREMHVGLDGVGSLLKGYTQRFERVIRRVGGGAAVRQNHWLVAEEVVRHGSVEDQYPISDIRRPVAQVALNDRPPMIEFR
jgi:hypothetical protein